MDTAEPPGLSHTGRLLDHHSISARGNPVAHDTAPTRIYRWFDSDEILLYVGISLDVLARTISHLDESPWTQYAARMEIEEVWPSSRVEAEQMERDRILVELPIFNRRDAPGWMDRIEAYLLLRDAELPEDLVGKILRTRLGKSSRSQAGQSAIRRNVRPVVSMRAADAARAASVDGAQVDSLMAAAESYPWASPSEIKAKIVLDVLLARARSTLTTSVAMAVREIAYATPGRMSAQCIQKATALLACAGWLTMDRGDGLPTTWPTIYRLHAPDSTPTGAHARVFNQDMAGVFGVHAALVYATLDPDIPQRKPSIVERSGVSKRTVDKWLKELALIGLARVSPRGWYQGDTDPTLVAAEFGALDQVERRALRHSLQREGWRQWYAARMEAREKGRRAARRAHDVEAATAPQPSPSEPPRTDPRPPETYARAVDPEGWAALESRFDARTADQGHAGVTDDSGGAGQGVHARGHGGHGVHKDDCVHATKEGRPNG